MELKLSLTWSDRRFGNISAGGLAGSASISTWVFERNVLTIGLIELPTGTQENVEINEKIKTYHAMTKLLWPAEWSTLVCISFVLLLIC